MISKSKLNRLFYSGDLKLSYSFTDLNGQLQHHPDPLFVDPNKQDDIAFRMFDKNCKSDRLTITLGSVVFSHNFEDAPGRIRFKDQPYTSHLLETNNRFILLPRETISLSSNEFIALGANHGAIIFPRLTLADAGLIYIPSYIDPTWQGVMQAVIHNFSDKTVELYLCEGLAACRFYQIDGEIDQHFIDNFKVHNHHYGQNWHGIYEGSREAVRLGKRPSLATTKSSNFHKKFDQFTRWYESNATKILLGTTILTIGTFFAASKALLLDLPNIAEKAEQVILIPTTGSLNITVPPEVFEHRFRHKIDRPKNVSNTAWLQLSPDLDNISNADALIAHTSDEQVELLIRIFLLEAFERPTDLSISYLVAP